MQAALIDCNISKLWKIYFPLQSKTEKVPEQGRWMKNYMFYLVPKTAL